MYSNFFKTFQLKTSQNCQTIRTIDKWVVGQKVKRQKVERHKVEWTKGRKWTKGRMDKRSNGQKVESGQKVERTKGRLDKKSKVEKRSKVDIIFINTMWFCRSGYFYAVEHHRGTTKMICFLFPKIPFLLNVTQILKKFFF